MNKDTFVALCLRKFNWTENEILKKKRSNGPEIKAGPLFSIIFEEEYSEAISKQIGFSETSLRTFMRSTFPGVVLTGKRTWKYYFIGELGYRRCIDCKSIKLRDEFHGSKLAKAGPGTADKVSVCKACDYTRRRQHQLDKPEMYRATNAAAKAAKIQAIPPWADLDKIRDIYLSCPEGYHVDHILPLRGVDSCGLHVENNLQYLPAQENLSKGNKVLPEYVC